MKVVVEMCDAEFIVKNDDDGDEKDSECREINVMVKMKRIVLG